MTIYYRITDGARRDLSPEQLAALQANGKAATLRLWVDDPRPTPLPTQIVERGGIEVGPTEAHYTWVVRDKTPEELQAEAGAAADDAERTALRAMIQRLRDDIAADPPDPTTLAQVVGRLRQIDTRQDRADRVLVYLLRQTLGD